MRSEQEIRDALISLSERGKKVGYSCRLTDILGERAKALAWVLRWADEDGQEIMKTLEISQESAAFIETLG